MSITALSKLISVPQPTLNRQISGESAMTLDILYSILNYFTDISAEWLLQSCTFPSNSGYCIYGVNFWYVGKTSYVSFAQTAQGR